MRKLVIGDIHGGYRAMIQALERAKFDKDNDLLIGIGDYCDGWSQSFEVIEYLRNLPNFVGILGNHDCFSEDTEVLTNYGWKKYHEVNLTDKILSLDTDTNKLCWDNINKIIIKKHSGVLYNFSNLHIDMCITENHRVLHQKRASGVWGDYKYDTIKNLSGRVRIPTSGVCDKDGVDLSDDELRFMAWVLTDGYIQEKGNYLSYSIYQSKEKTIEHIRNLLNSLGYKFSEYVRSRDIKEVCGKELKKECLNQQTFYINGNEAQKLRKFFTEKIPFPSVLFDLNKRQFDIFLNEVVLGDGTFYNRGEEWTSIIHGKKEFLDSMQMLCIQNGYRAVIATDTRGCYRLNISEYTSTSFDVQGKVKEVPYEGIVWCLSVPKTNFMVRRNGKPFISGNCWLLDWFYCFLRPRIWTSQGGKATLQSYSGKGDYFDAHRNFLANLPAYLVIDNKMFVHGGFIDPIDDNEKWDLLWDREMFFYTFRNPGLSPWNIGNYDEVYIGHSTTSILSDELKPLHRDRIWAIDTGAGYEGKLTVMDIHTHEYWQSDNVNTLYPGVKGR